MHKQEDCHHMAKERIGILGGMGPMATADLFQKIVALTKADSDNDHIRIYIDNNPDPRPHHGHFKGGEGSGPPNAGRPAPLGSLRRRLHRHALQHGPLLSGPAAAGDKNPLYQHIGVYC